MAEKVLRGMTAEEVQQFLAVRDILSERHYEASWGTLESWLSLQGIIEREVDEDDLEELAGLNPGDLAARVHRWKWGGHNPDDDPLYRPSWTVAVDSLTGGFLWMSDLGKKKAAPSLSATASDFDAGKWISVNGPPAAGKELVVISFVSLDNAHVLSKERQSAILSELAKRKADRL
jgi:hypothetical protein